MINISAAVDKVNASMSHAHSSTSNRTALGQNATGYLPPDPPGSRLVASAPEGRRVLAPEDAVDIGRRTPKQVDKVGAMRDQPAARRNAPSRAGRCYFRGRLRRSIRGRLFHPASEGVGGRVRNAPGGCLGFTKRFAGVLDIPVSSGNPGWTATHGNRVFRAKHMLAGNGLDSDEAA